MRILLVEDEVTLADSVSRRLRGEGFDVDWTANGVDGLWQATEGAYDVIVLDIMLPGLNGYEVCRQLREAEVWTPILMLTAKEGELDEADAFELGADDYLRKPFFHVVLIARLRSLTRRVPPARTAGITFGPLVLDPGSLTCARAGQIVELSPREFALLETLVRRAPSIVPKGDLIDIVWGMDFIGDQNIVEVYIGYLRKKIDKPFNEPLLKTVRGVGYQLVDPT